MAKEKKVAKKTVKKKEEKVTEEKKIKKANQKKPVKKKRRGGFFRKLVFLVLLFSLGFVTLAWHKEKNKEITPAQVKELKSKETELLLEEVAEHLVLPDGQPSVATVLDAEKLKKELPFFEKAQNGFKVIVYPNKAILFDPTNSIVVDVAPVVQGKDGEIEEQAQAQAQENDQVDSNEDNQTEEENDESEEDSEASTDEEEDSTDELDEGPPAEAENIEDENN